MSDMIYRLVLKARFEDEAQLERAIQGLSRLELAGANVTVKMGAMGRQASLGFSSIASSVLRLGYMFNMLESAYMRMTIGQMMVERGQVAYNKAVERFGKNSEEARQAAKQLGMQMKYLNMANMRANISMGLMLIQLGLQSKFFESATASQIAHTVATKAATAAGWLYNSMLSAKVTLMAALKPWMVPLMIGAGTATAAYLATIGTSGQSVTPPKTEINIETDVHVETNIEDALAEQNRRVKQEVRSAMS